MNRTEAEASTYPLPFARVLEQVKPERATKSPAIQAAPWWLHLRSRPEMRRAIEGMPEVLVIAIVSKSVMPMRVPTGQVFSNKLDVFATASYSDQAVLSSSLHQMWAIRFGATMRADPAYTPSTVFEPFPRPQPTEELDALGRRLDAARREVMIRRQLGLTRLYNLVNDPDVSDEVDVDIAQMRALHVRLDKAVAAAYSWHDLALDHGFYEYRQVTRWTVKPAARDELLDRLLEENLRRASRAGDGSPA